MLKVFLDGALLPDAEGRAFWARFSAHMDAHKGDLAGFAKAEGLASVHPEMRGGEAALVASKTAPQRAYTTARAGGSPDPPQKPRPNQRHGQKPGDKQKGAGKSPKRRG